MMKLPAPPPVFIDGIAFWTPAWPGWPLAAAALRGEPVAAADPPPRRPAPTALAANERRRAPDSVLLALEVAQAAVADSGHDQRALASVFSSAFGDLPIVDALCRTLAEDPLLLSPTRFHHSVHNAASGYWGITSGSHCASTALAAFDHSFAAGLLEAATQCAADGQPLLLVGYDTEACGPLASVNTSRGMLGLALVLAAQRGPRTCFQLDWWLAAAETGSEAGSEPSFATCSAIHPSIDSDIGAAEPVLAALAGNAQADGLPLFAALALGKPTTLALPVTDGLLLHLALQPA